MTLLDDLPRLVAQAERRIRSQVLETPLERSEPLSRLADAEVYLKLENLQRTGSFKLRGAMSKLLSLSEAERARGLTAASTGNHGLAVAHALAGFDAPGTIVLPEHSDPHKVEALRALGATLIFHGTDCEQTERFARAKAEAQEQIFISPYNDPDVVAGQGTIGVEIARQLDGELHALFTSVGGGGLMAGVGSTLRSVWPGIELVGCWPAHSPVLYESIRAGHIVERPSLPTLSDATAGGVEPGAITFELCRQLIAERVLVDEDEIRHAVRLVLQHHGLVIEGAAGVAVAGFLKTRRRYVGKTVALVLCGRNIGWSELRDCLADRPSQAD